MSRRGKPLTAGDPIDARSGAAWWAEFVARTEYLRDLADQLELDLRALGPVSMSHDHAADLVSMRAKVAEAEAMIEAWRVGRLCSPFD